MGLCGCFFVALVAVGLVNSQSKTVVKMHSEMYFLNMSLYVRM